MATAAAAASAASAGALVPTQEQPVAAEEPQPLEAKSGDELTDDQFSMYLMNEDTVCPGCGKPFAPMGQEPVGKMVLPLRLDCQHAICKKCSKKFKLDQAAFMGKACVRCQFEKRDQLGHGPYKCRFLTECDLDEDGFPILPVSEEIQRICKALRESGVVIGSHPCKRHSFWYKACHQCGMPATRVTKEKPQGLCNACYEKEEPKPDFWTLEEYEKNVVRSHKCCKCGKEAIMFCAMCDKYYCKDRNCYDACKDPDHVLVTFLPNISEMKRQEYQDIESSRKMFLDDVHEYNDLNPFMRRLYDLECFKSAVFELYKKRFERDECGIEPTPKKKGEEEEEKDEELVFENDDD